MRTQTPIRGEQDQAVEKKVEQLRELFADAPELGKKALENALQELKSQVRSLRLELLKRILQRFLSELWRVGEQLAQLLDLFFDGLILLPSDRRLRPHGVLLSAVFGWRMTSRNDGVLGVRARADRAPAATSIAISASSRNPSCGRSCRVPIPRPSAPNR